LIVVPIYQQAADGLLAKGRDKDRSVIRIPIRRRKNIVSLAMPEYGKTAIAEGVAQILVIRTSVPSAPGYRLVSLELAALVAGTKYRVNSKSGCRRSLKKRIPKHHRRFFLDQPTIVGAGAAAAAWTRPIC
jgi:ATP-dependent Clp protease ATP-binding subunit ClpC